MKSYKDLPRDYRFASEREWEKKRIITEALLKLKIHGYSTMFQSFDSFEDFKVSLNSGNCVRDRYGHDDSQRAREVAMTSYRRRCDVITSHRRQFKLFHDVMCLLGYEASGKCYCCYCIYLVFIAYHSLFANTHPPLPLYVSCSSGQTGT